MRVFRAAIKPKPQEVTVQLKIGEKTRSGPYEITFRDCQRMGPESGYLLEINAPNTPLRFGVLNLFEKTKEKFTLPNGDVMILELKAASISSKDANITIKYSLAQENKPIPKEKKPVSGMPKTWVDQGTVLSIGNYEIKINNLDMGKNGPYAEIGIYDKNKNLLRNFTSEENKQTNVHLPNGKTLSFEVSTIFIGQKKRLIELGIHSTE